MKQFWVITSCYIYIGMRYVTNTLCKIVLKLVTPKLRLWIEFFCKLSIFYCTWCTETDTGKIFHIIVRIPIHSLLCALNFMLPVCRSSFACSSSHHINDRAALVYWLIIGVRTHGTNRNYSCYYLCGIAQGSARNARVFRCELLCDVTCVIMRRVISLPCVCPSVRCAPLCA